MVPIDTKQINKYKSELMKRLYSLHPDIQVEVWCLDSGSTILVTVISPVLLCLTPIFEEVFVFHYLQRPCTHLSYGNNLQQYVGTLGYSIFREEPVNNTHAKALSIL